VSRPGRGPWLAGVVAAAVVAASLVPVAGGGHLPALPGSVGSDALLHAVGYAVVAAAAASGLAGDGRSDRAVAVAAVVLATALGVGVELCQWPLPTRTASVGDAVANAAGALVGAGLWVGGRWDAAGE
jgi:hypothetical protein